MDHDSTDLEALFDSIVTANAGADIGPASAPPAEGDVFSKVGHMTRGLHESLRELGYDNLIERTVGSLPDTRDRLGYIAAKTQEAAERTLTAAELAQPIQTRLGEGAQALSRDWERMFANALSVDEFRDLAARTHAYLAGVPEQTREANARLMEIVMAQDFQDLTGQVIKRLVETAQTIETQLVQLLIEVTPEDKRGEVGHGLLNGPVINAQGRSDVVTSQAQVDDLLDSLGF
jgi:chemotaxis protein CheZ